MERIIALDVGDRRIGLAISDALGWTAQGLTTLERKGMEKDMEFLKGLIQEHQVRTLVSGLPRNMNGTIGPQGEKVKVFMEALVTALGDYECQVVFWDERLTSVAAHKAMLEGDLSRKKRKGHVDRLAAVLILQGYLDRLTAQKRHGQDH